MIYNYQGNGIIFKLSSSEESITYGYTDPSDLAFIADDYGTTTELATESIDYENFSLAIEEEDGGSILILGNVEPFGGLNLYGSANTEWINKNFFGAGEYKVVYSPDDTSGTLFSFGEQIGSRTYGYTDPSDLAFNTDDYGLISEVHSESIDYSQDLSQTDNTEDNGSILVLGNIQPFGGLTLSGSANTKWINQNFSGAGEYKVVYSPDNTSGTLFSFGEKIESAAYVYTDPSSLEFNADDYGSVTELATEFIDYDQDLSPTDNIEDNGSILISGSIEPFGGITLSGSALTQVNYRLFLYGQATEIKLTYSPDDTSGTLFSFGEKIESRTYDYNETAIFTYDELDYGFISQPTDQFDEDYVFVSNPADASIDNGILFGITEVILPFGGFELSGSAIEKVTADTPEDTQLFSISGSALEKDVESYVASGILTFSGSTVEQDTESYVASGGINLGKTYNNVSEFSSDQITFDSTLKTFDDSLPVISFSSALESFSADYNETSIFTFDNLDYGFISESTNQSDEDYKSISDPADANIDNGNLVGFGATESILPFGGLTLSGSSIEKITADTPEDTQLFTISGSALEKDAESYNTFGTVTFSGSALEQDTESYVGIGTLFSFGEKIESRTYDYNETSIFTFDDLDYGFISNNYDEIQDYKSISDPPDANIDNGNLVGFGATETLLPFGRSTFSGSALESFSAQTPEDTQLFNIFGELVHPNIDYTPHYGIEKNIGIGTTGIQFSGSALESDIESYVASGIISLNQLTSALESFSAQTPEDTQLFNISGSALESFSAQTPEDTQLFSISGSASEKDTESYNTFGIVTFSGSALESDIESYVASGIISLNQLTSALESFSAQTPEDTQLFNISGSALESFSAQTPEDTVLHTFNGVARTYSPIYPRNSGDPGAGIGTIRINDDAGLTITRAIIPYFGRGTIFLSGNGFESFSIVNYDGSGILTFSGISSNREINVYQDYVTSGIITISQQTQPIIEKHTESYVGIGNIIKFGTLSDERIINNYAASGDINLGKTILGNICGDSEQFGSSTTTFDSTLSTFDILCYSDGNEAIFSSALESYSAQTPEETILYTFSGFSLESYSAQTPEDTVLYEFSGNIIDERRTYGYSGSGELTLESGAVSQYIPSISGFGGLRFTTRLSDNIYDTCDSIDITSDYQNSAFVSFTANVPESTQLFSILGSADTSEINVYEYNGVGNLALSGSLIDRGTDSYVGIGTLFTVSGGNEVGVNSYVGNGSLVAISGSSESKSSQTPENTILINISGTASTKLEYEYSYSGIGTAYIGSSALTLFESDYLYSGVGSITLSGELIHPDIKFIPASKGFGLFTLSGISSNSGSYVDELSGNKNLFTFYGGFESFSKSTYIGLGTIYIQEVSSITINNPFQIPRTYVIII